jgi:phage tail-like protein
MSRTDLAVRRPAALGAHRSDLEAIEEVVRVGFPVQAARTYLKRHLGNEVQVRLVEAIRGEPLGHVRAAEVLPAGGGEPMRVRAVRRLPDGSPASFHAPEDQVTVTSAVDVPGGNRFTPSPRDVVLLVVPVRGYTRYLPSIYQGQTPMISRRDVVRLDETAARRLGARALAPDETVPDDAEAFRRFLFVFQHLMTTVLDKVDRIPSLTDPITADPRFLPWIASWVHFELDGSLPVHQQRELVRRAIRLYRNRGTKEGMEDMIRVLTSTPVRVLEREKPPPAALGRMVLSGGRDLAGRYLKTEPRACFLIPHHRTPIRYFALALESRIRFDRRFGERAVEVLHRITRIVTAEKPAHVLFTIRFDET